MSKQVYKVEGSTSSTTHSFSEEEKVAFADYINQALKSDADVKHLLPISTADMSLFTSVKDGLLLCKLINDAIPGTIDERVLNKKNPNTFQIHENQIVAINSAKSIGCNVINIGAQDLIEGRSHLVLGLIWQIVKIGLFARINLVNHPELYRLLEDGETIEDLLALPADQILLRWFNYHLKNAKWGRRVANFSGDIKDAENYTVLLAQIAPQHCDRKPLSESDLTKRSEAVLVNADKLGCRKFVTAKDIVKGNAKLNLAFVATLFNTWPALEPMEQPVEVIQETREEKQYRAWMNALGVEPFVNNLYTDLRDGLVLLKLFDQIEPGCVDWKKVYDPPKNNFNKLANCNYCIDIGKSLKFSLVGISGDNIQSGNKTLTLAIVWQMMRYHYVSILQKLGNGQKIGDQDIIDWANAKVKSAGKSTSMRNFKDKSLNDSMFILDLCDAIKPGVVNYDVIVKKATSDKDVQENAKYSISVARKVGAVVFALPDDIWELKDKMLMTLFAGLMAVDKGVHD